MIIVMERTGEGNNNSNNVNLGANDHPNGTRKVYLNSTFSGIPLSIPSSTPMSSSVINSSHQQQQHHQSVIHTVVSPSMRAAFDGKINSQPSSVSMTQPQQQPLAPSPQSKVDQSQMVLQSRNSSLQACQHQTEQAQVMNSVKNEVDSKLEGSDRVEESIKLRRERLFRRPSYRKILNDISRAEFGCVKIESSGSDCDSSVDTEISPNFGSCPTSYQPSATTAIGHLQLSSHCGNVQGLPAAIMPTSISGSESLIQYQNHQDEQYYVPNDTSVVSQNNSVGVGGIDVGMSNSLINEDQIRKRELRLYKNREAARECRRKKKEYIKCLENRVAVLESQNKALIDELKSLKELYCQHKPE